MNRQLIQNRIDLLWELVKTNFKMRYQNSVLGVLWVLIKPYSTFIVLYFVWSALRGNQGIPNYPLYLLIGIVFYTFINELVILGQLSLLDRASIILKTSFPQQIAVVAALINALINLGINLILIAAILLLSGIGIQVGGLIYLFFIVLTTFVFALALAFFTSIITIRLRDLKNIFELALFLLYWASPIFYSLEHNIIPGRVGELVAANPIGVFINQVRASLGVYGEVNPPVIAAYLAVGIVFCVLGWVFFSRQVKKIAEYF